MKAFLISVAALLVIAVGAYFIFDTFFEVQSQQAYKTDNVRLE